MSILAIGQIERHKASIWFFACGSAGAIFRDYVWACSPFLGCRRDRLAFSIPAEQPAPNIAASWNVAPTDPLPIVRFDPKAGQRSLDVMRWGLVPFWAKDIKVGFASINAKAEGMGKNRRTHRG
jgi:hypothetical protein